MGCQIRVKEKSNLHKDKGLFPKPIHTQFDYELGKMSFITPHVN